MSKPRLAEVESVFQSVVDLLLNPVQLEINNLAFLGADSQALLRIVGKVAREPLKDGLLAFL